MKQQIATKLHELASVVSGLPETTNHYVIAPDLLQAMSRDDVVSSIGALVQCGIARLPYKNLLVEFTPAPPIVRFVWLSEADGKIVARVGAWSPSLAILSDHDVNVVLGETSVEITGNTLENEGETAVVAAMIALQMLNIRGIEREHIECKRLNVQRERHNKPSIGKHTLLKIGVVYDREGAEVARGSGGIKSVYLRAGHVRNQACGPKYQDHKLIYIEPVLVNYRAGDVEPTARRIIAMGGKVAA